ncbi:hypothetical protein [uncultured Maribacter sp.]|uniref:hypothetical protein n=1 Tax=uncultured Maribacter sp. TaxID=431308 RepID=UPI00262F1B29|nr:hypothetical protein [uncultured Maribacter sp.]
MNNNPNYIKKIGVHIFLLMLYLINPFDKGFLAGYLIILLIYINPKFILKNIDSTFFSLILFSLVYAGFYLFDMKQGVQWLLIYALFPSSIYLLGKKVTPYIKKPMHLFYIIFTLGFLYSLTGLISVGFNLLEGGFVQLGRSIPDFWTGKEKLATAMGAFFIFNMAIPGLLIVGKKKLPLFFKLVTFGIFIASLLCVFRLGSRTQISLVVLSILIAIVYLLKSQNTISNIKLLLGIVTITLLAYNYLSIDLDADYLSSLGERLQSSDNASSAGGRTQRWEKSIINLYKKPLGWDVREFGYSHNMWFDAARNGSIISFILLLIFSIQSFKNIKQAINLNKQNTLFNATILIYNIVIFSQLFVEPALESLFILFAFFCFIQGVINAYITLEEKKKLTSNINI